MRYNTPRFLQHHKADVGINTNLQIASYLFIILIDLRIVTPSAVKI
jgi:hypothetical protein